MNLLIRGLALTVVLVLGACGGGGGGSTSISVNPTSLSFQASTSDGQKSASVTASYEGDGVIVGYPPGVAEPSWLSVVTVADNPGRATFSVNANPAGLTPGSYSTTLRFVTGRIDSDGDASQIKSRDVPVSFTVTEFRLSPEAISLEAPRGSTANLTGALTLEVAGGQSWSASDNQPWLTVRSSGTGPGAITYTVNPSGLALGVHTATVTVTAPGGLSDTATLSLTIRAAQLTASPSAPAFTVATDNDSATLEQTLHVSDELDGGVAGSAIAWSLQSISEPWLTMSPASGSSAPGVNATLSLVEAQLATMPNGSYTANVILAYTDAEGLARTLVVPVTLDLDSPLQSVSVTPGSAQRVAGGASVQFTATGTYATGYSANLTDEANWTASTGAVTVGNGGAQAKGLGTPTAPGTATVTAAMPGTAVSGSATVTVIAPLGYAYISGYYASGIDQYIFGEDGELSPMNGHETVHTGSGAGIIRISPSGDFAYASSGLGIHQFTVAAGGYLVPMSPAIVPNSANTGIIEVDPSEQYVYATAYDPAASRYVVRHYRIGSDGRLSLISASAPGVNDAWEIDVLPSGAFLYVTGSYEASSYSIGADGTPSPLGTRVPARQSLALHPSGTAAYAITQYDVRQYSVGADGSLTLMSPGSVPLGEGSTIGSHVVLDPTGKHLYAIDSYQDRIRHYVVGADLQLTASGTDATNVPYTPLYVEIEPSGKYLYVTGNTGTLAKFTLDANGDFVGAPTLMNTNDSLPRGLAVRAGH